MPRYVRRGLAFAIAGLLGVAIPIALASTGTWSTQPAQLSTNSSADTAMVPSAALSNNGDIASAWLNQVVSGTSTTNELDAVIDGGSGFGPAQNVGPADPLETEGESTLNLPDVAEDGTGHAVAVWVDNGRLMWAEQSPPATSFTEAPNAIDSAESSPDAIVDGDEHVAMDTEGDAIAVWSQEDLTTGHWSVMYSILPAGSGQTFGTVVTLASGIGNDPDPQVSVNQHGGSVTVAYLDGTSLYAFEDYLHGLASDPSSYGGLPTSGTQIYTDSDSATLEELSIAVDADGETAFAWVDNGEVWSATLEYRESSFTANGSEFSPEYIKSGGSESDPEVAMYPSNSNDGETAVAFYDSDSESVVVAARSSEAFAVNGNGWESASVPTYSEAAGEQQPQLSIASDGVVTMVWEGQGSGEGVNALDALSSDDNGNFASSSPTTLDENIDSSECDGISCVTVGANTPGDLVATWSQLDASSNPQIEAQCLQANSATGYTGTDTNVSTQPSTLTPSSCVEATTTSTTTTSTTTTTGTTTTGTTTTDTGTTATTANANAGAGTTASTSTTTTTAATPKVAQTIVATTVTGTATVILPGSSTPVPLSSLQSIPNGAVIEPGTGTVTLTFALPDGQTETGTFWGGDFKVLQAPGGGVNLTLVGGSFKGCPAPRHNKKGHSMTAGAATAGLPNATIANGKKKPGAPVRSLWSNAKGNFTTKGQNGAAAVLGTTWLTRDQCDGTYFYVKRTSNDPQGAIEVTVLHPHRHRVKLKRGHSLLAPAPGYS